MLILFVVRGFGSVLLMYAFSCYALLGAVILAGKMNDSWVDNNNLAEIIITSSSTPVEFVLSCVLAAFMATGLVFIGVMIIKHSQYLATKLNGLTDGIVSLLKERG